MEIILGFFGVLFVFAIAIFLYGVNIYNTLVSLKNRYLNAFAQIEVQLKRRYDLIPNLVNTAKGYLSHEKETLEAVISARNTASSSLNAAASAPGSTAAMTSLGDAESALGNAMGRLNVVMEAYPDLKGDQIMMQLTEELTTTENKVSFSRQGFNDQVMEYNIFKQSFPSNILAGIFGHSQDATLLEFADSETIQQAPEVSF
jgi:LemA protein